MYSQSQTPTNGVVMNKYLNDRPYGQQPDPNDRLGSVKNYEEIATIDTIRQRYKEGDSYRAIARWLNGTDVPTRKGTSWHPQQIQRILKREGLI